MKVTLPIKAVSVANLREHWSAKARRVKSQRQMVWFALIAKPPTLLPCVVTLTRIAPRELDGDNLQSAFKGIRDQVAVYLGVPDNDKRIDWRYAQRKSGKGKYAVEVEVHSLDAPIEDAA